ncbi:MAG: hypothetical protein K6A36_02110 [Paludibacteraceae bacterium]|nr:hypothetical protein [Paludibacteraceae bacterium]
MKLYQRWQVFQYDKDTTLLIAIKQQSFIYKGHNKIIGFGSSDIEEWYWDSYTFDPYNVCAEIVDIRLKNGERIILSNGIGPVAEFFRENWKELGMPKGKRSSESFVSYMKEIESQQS